MKRLTAEQLAARHNARQAKARGPESVDRAKRLQAEVKARRTT